MDLVGTMGPAHMVPIVLEVRPGSSALYLPASETYFLPFLALLSKLNNTELPQSSQDTVLFILAH